MKKHRKQRRNLIWSRHDCYSVHTYIQIVVCTHTRTNCANQRVFFMGEKKEEKEREEKAMHLDFLKVKTPCITKGRKKSQKLGEGLARQAEICSLHRVLIFTVSFDFYQILFTNLMSLYKILNLNENLLSAIDSLNAWFIHLTSAIVDKEPGKQVVDFLEENENILVSFR